MNKQPMASTTGTNTTQPARPQWWTEKHTSTWDRVKEALRRDWEQTKSDFSSSDGRDLNQDVGDTIKQATGSAPIPPPNVQTHADDPRDAAKLVEKQIKAKGDAQEKVVAAQTDAAVARVKAQGDVAHEQQVAQEQMVAAQQKANEQIADAQRKANEKVAKAQEKAGEKIADAQQKAAEKSFDWNGVEPAVRYGYGARSQYADAPGWDEAEERLEREWSQLRGNSSWNDARSHIRRGWDAATRNSVV